MVACLRSARFIYPDNSASIFVELRRIHDTLASADNKTFVVTRRLGQTMINKSFGTLSEARRWWTDQVTQLTDQGLRRVDSAILGFHEED